MIPNKNSIRKQMMLQRSVLTPSYLNQAGDTALKKITQLEVYQKSKTVMLYMNYRNEVPTGEIISEVVLSSKRLILPLTDNNFNIVPYEIISQNRRITDSLRRSTLGIFEPNPELCTIIDPSRIDLVIIPGVAFDKSGNRMGYGKGCYDKFLPLLNKHAYKLALAYDFQVLDSIPTDTTDIKMDYILTV